MVSSPDRVVDVATTKTVTDARLYFSQFGDIAAVHPWMTDKGHHQHYFVEFCDAPGAMRASSAISPDFGIQALFSRPDLVDRFLSISQASVGSVSPHGLTLEASSSYSTSPAASDPDSKRKKTRRAGVRLKLRQAMNTDIDCNPINSALPTPPVSAIEPGMLSQAFFPPLSFQAVDISLTTRLRPDDNKENELQSELPSPVSPLQLHGSGHRPYSAGSLVASGLPALQTNLVLSLCGETICYDLQTLEENPKAIISLLKTTASERDKWMVVGGFYRRMGNAKAAIAVVSTMLEEMAGRHGMKEQDLRPAFLMLSSCCTDLGKNARGPDGATTEASSAYFDQSRRWLQKVYGEQIPENDLPRNGVSPRASTIDDALARLIASGAIPSAGSPAQPSASGDVRALRDMQSNQASEFSAIRAAKRKLEEECADERALRKKLEYALCDVEKQLVRSRDMEGSVLQQVRAEIEARRRAEEKACKERDARIKVEKERERDWQERELKEREAKERGGAQVGVIFQELAGMFQRAAGGDVSSLAGMAGMQGSMPSAPLGRKEG
ncbi:hypothetical protein EWM64_g999 [Hericium alpestre]|uniref:Uncharacterized protein n=1 Tax=Hericium alpestre TaxID=135208 RepID=A0A4Z0A9T3_9AGAM|nr:hypothetical protein EWM64_g999 [Hericium alpestre]